MSLNAAATFLAQGDAGATALLTRDGSWTYRQLRRAANAVGAHYTEHVSTPILLLGNNCLEWVAGYLGIMRAGGTVVPLSPRMAESQLKAVVRSLQATRALCTTRALRSPVVSAVLDECGVRTSPLEAIVADDVADTPVSYGSEDRLATVMFTSGSTGAPKGVMISHGNLVANTADIVEYLALDASDRVMCVLPFHYCFGLSLLHTHLQVGASVVLDDRFMFTEKVLDRLVETGCTGFAGVPSTYHILCRRSRFLSRKLPSLRWLQQAGGHLAPTEVQRIRAAHPDVRFFVMYGQTEATARLSYLPPERLDRKPGAIGAGLSSTRLEVRRDDGTTLRPGADEIGEIVAFGPNIALGYWRDALETRRYFRDGGLYTGDLARIDPEGDLHIVGRTRDFVKSFGNRVAILRVESAVMQLEGVVECAVVGVPDEMAGEVIWAFVIWAGTDAFDGTQLRAELMDILDTYETPARVVRLDELPKTDSGKVRRPELVERAHEMKRSGQ